jgi:hypothetical protein
MAPLSLPLVGGMLLLAAAFLVAADLLKVSVARLIGLMPASRPL